MTLDLDSISWDGLLRPSRSPRDPSHFANLHAGKSVLVTGAGGSIGSALALALQSFTPSNLVLLDSSEQNLFRIDSQLSAEIGPDHHVPILGSVTDERWLRDIFERYHPEIVYHAAALKHAPLGERNPFAVVQNNVFGTLALATTARRFCAARLIMISTDKAANPRSIMGASKRLAELVLLAMDGDRTRMRSIRLGNVLGSEGSVVPLFLEQIHHGGPVTVTHPEVDRYFLTMPATVNCVFTSAADQQANCAVYVPAMEKPTKIVDLARYLISQISTGDIPITYAGLRPGDKLHEEFISDRESMSHEPIDGLHRIDSPHLSESELTIGLDELNAAVCELNPAKLLATVTRLVPEYQPSAFLRDQVAAAAT
jgi:FlaA1/EpsC-like NDP-sugar epimerase